MSDPREILLLYLELCTNGIHRLDSHLASNAILEWTGVTVKGRSKIVKFMRHKLQDGLVQKFTNADLALPFEERESHFSTMSTPPENLVSPSTEDDISHPTNNKSCKETSSPNMNQSFETPPRSHPIASEPPPLTAGRQFLPLSSSDEEDDTAAEPPYLTPESPAPASEPRQNAYSELQYLEAIGTVRTYHESKHRGTRTSHHIPRDETSPSDESNTSSASNADSAGPADKRTKLKLSYRSHLQTTETQFALIIYEDLTPRSSKVRRNLFSDVIDSEYPEPSSPVNNPPSTSGASPEARALPDTPPSAPSPPPGEITPPQTPLVPPGTPHRQRRIPPVGFRTSPRRSRAIMNFTIAADGPNGSSSTNGNNNNNLQTWPRKTHPGAGSPGGASAAKNRKLATGSTSVRKPLRF